MCDQRAKNKIFLKSTSEMSQFNSVKMSIIAIFTIRNFLITTKIYSKYIQWGMKLSRKKLMRAYANCDDVIELDDYVDDYSSEALGTWLNFPYLEVS